MNMNSSLVKKSFLRTLVWSGVALLSATVALAQDPAPQNADPQNTGQVAAASGPSAPTGRLKWMWCTPSMLLCL